MLSRKDASAETPSFTLSPSFRSHEYTECDQKPRSEDTKPLSSQSHVSKPMPPLDLKRGIKVDSNHSKHLWYEIK